MDARELTFAWPGKARLIDIERFTLHRAERVFLRGPSGSGKSTLLSLLGGVLQPSGGEIHLLGKAINEMSAGERDRFRGEQIGFIFQMFNLIPYLDVVENVMLPGRFSKLREQRIIGEPVAEAKRLLAAIGLNDPALLSRPVTELSIGQQQRVAAARALYGKPGLIIADEPTSSLDQDARENFLTLLMDECRAQGASLLFVSHDTQLGARFDRVVALKDINRAATDATGESLA
ncbi:MAG: ABC transporter ATP-binding protein [Gammaproteobacteria bacterium]|nr:ABC transporter ATP-binding protein [Gammaproteobacteria bacterium]